MNGSPLPPAVAEGGETVLRPLLRAIGSHRLLVGLAVIAALAGAASYLALRTPAYEATAGVLVNPLPQDDATFLGVDLLRDAGDPTRTVQTAAALIETPRTAQATARNLGEGWSAEEVLDDVSVAPQGETNVLGVTATDDTAEGAAELANEFVQSALQVRRQDLTEGLDAAIERILDTEAEQPGGISEAQSRRLSRLREVEEAGDPTLSLAQPAVAPASPSHAAPVLVIFLALLAGLAIGSGSALLLELFDRRLRDEEDVLAVYNLPIVARIPLLRRRQLPAYLASRQMPSQVAERFHTLALQLELRRPENRSIMITSASQGDGKTTCAVQLAIAMVSSGKRVILFDGDLRRPGLGEAVGLAEGAPPADGISIGAGATLESLAAPVPGIDNLLAVPAEAIGGGLTISDALRGRLRELLREAEARADVVVIDTPPLGEVGDALLIAPSVDDIVLVARTGNTERGALAAVAGLFQQSGHEPIGYVILESLRTMQSGYYTSQGVAQPRQNEFTTMSSPPSARTD